MTEENKKKKEYLEGYEKAVRQVNRIDFKIQELRYKKYSPSVINDGMPHASGQSDLSGYAALIDHEERRYLKARYKKVRLCKEIMDRIERLTDEDEKDILLYRYIKLMKWEDICVNTGYSWKWVHKIHSRALSNFIV